MAKHVDLMGTIRGRCPLLAERMDRETFLDMLVARGIPCDDSMLERVIHAGIAEPLQAGGVVFTRGHMLVLYQMTRHSRIDWLPWDDSRPDREDVLMRRALAKRLIWEQIRQDAECLRNFYGWFWGDDIGTFPVADAVRVTDLVGWTLLNIDQSGYLGRLAEGQGRWQEAQGPVLLAAEMARLRDEVGRILRDAKEAGFAVPVMDEALRARMTPKDLSARADDENPLFVAPSRAMRHDDRTAFLVRRDELVLRQQWPELAEHLQAHRDLFTDGGDGEVAFYGAMGALYRDHLGHIEEATAAYKRILMLRPGHAYGIASLDDLLSAQGMWEEWAQILEQQVAAVGNQEIGDTLALLRARVLATYLGRGVEAMTVFGKSLADATSHDDAFALLADLVLDHVGTTAFDLEALALLGRYARDDEERLSLAEMLEVVENRVQNPEEQARLLVIEASVDEAVGQVEKAFITMSRALSLSPLSEEIFQGLERLSQALDNKEEFAAVLEDEIEKAQDLSSRAWLAERLGRLHLELGNTEQALTTLEIASKAAPERADLLIEMASLYREVEKPECEILLRERAAVLLSEGQERLANDEALASLRGLYATQPQMALRVYEAMLTEPTLCDRGMEGLLALVDSEALPVAWGALRQVEAHWVQAEAWGELMAAYGRLADADDPSIDRVQILARLCELLEAQDAPKEERLRRLGQRFALTGEAGAAEQGRALVEDRQDAMLWAAAVEETLPRRADPDLLPRWHHLGAWYLEQEGREEACETYGQILDIFPGDGPAFSALEGLMLEEERWRDVVDLYARFSEAVPAERLPLALRAAEVLAERLEDLRAAYERLHEVLTDDPNHPRAKEVVERLFAREDLAAARLEMFETVESLAQGELWLRARLGRAAIMAERAGEKEASVALLSDPVVLRSLELEAPAFRKDFKAKVTELLGQRLADLPEVEALGQLFRDDERPGTPEPVSPPSPVAAPPSVPPPAVVPAAPAAPLPPVTSPPPTAPTAPIASVAPPTPPPVPARLPPLPGTKAGAAGAAPPVLSFEERADELVTKGDIEGACAMLEREAKAQKEPSARGRLLVKAAELYEKSGKSEVAEQNFKLALAHNNADVRYVDHLTAFYRRRRVPAKLLVMLRHRLVKSADVPMQIAVLGEIANVSEQLGDYVGATRALHDLLSRAQGQELSLDRYAVRRNMATLQIQQGAFAAAQETLVELCAELRRDKASVRHLGEALTDLAVTHHALGEDEKAWEVLREAEELSLALARMRLVQAGMHLEARAFVQAAESAEKGLGAEDLAPALRVQLLDCLARALVGQSKTEEARRVYGQILELAPQDPGAKAFLDGTGGGAS